jgi:hypothetical protein
LTSVERFFEDYAIAWATNDPARLEALWDTDDPMPVYLAEEHPVAMTDWPAVRAYWQNNHRYIERIRLRFGDFTFKHQHGDELVTAVFQMRWDLQLRDPGHAAAAAMGGDNRVVATLRRTAQGWRLCAWVEAPLAALPYLQQLYARNVSADF